MAKPKLKELAIDTVRDPKVPARGEHGFGDLDDLTSSVRQVGIIEPLVVAQRNGHVEVVAGHRRLLAARAAGLVTVPCVVYDTFAVAEEAVMLHENTKRADLAPVDEARWFLGLLAKFDDDTERLADALKEKREYVESRLALLDGDPDVLAALEQNLIGIGVAQELNLYEHAPTRRAHTQLAVQGGASTSLVRAWRKEANRFHALQQTRADDAPQAEPAPPAPVPANPFVCYFCSSDEHIEQMEQVYIHSPCKTLLKRALARGFEQE